VCNAVATQILEVCRVRNRRRRCVKRKERNYKIRQNPSLYTLHNAHSTPPTHSLFTRYDSFCQHLLWLIRDSSNTTSFQPQPRKYTSGKNTTFPPGGLPSQWPPWLPWPPWGILLRSVTPWGVGAVCIDPIKAQWARGVQGSVRGQCPQGGMLDFFLMHVTIISMKNMYRIMKRIRFLHINLLERVKKLLLRQKQLYNVFGMSCLKNI
jgi:hypothetical protein